MFESRHKPVFGEDDVVNMFPVVKHLKPTGTDATRLVQHAQVAVQQGERRKYKHLQLHKIQYIGLHLERHDGLAWVLKVTDH